MSSLEKLVRMLSSVLSVFWLAIISCMRIRSYSTKELSLYFNISFVIWSSPGDLRFFSISVPCLRLFLLFLFFLQYGTQVFFNMHNFNQFRHFNSSISSPWIFPRNLLYSWRTGKFQFSRTYILGRILF